MASARAECGRAHISVESITSWLTRWRRKTGCPVSRNAREKWRTPILDGAEEVGHPWTARATGPLTILVQTAHRVVQDVTCHRLPKCIPTRACGPDVNATED